MAETPAQTKDLGETWLLTNQTLFANLNASAKAYIVREVELAHRYFTEIAEILNVTEPEGGVILESENSTLTIGNFGVENGTLTTADGEWIEDAKPSFDYCLARM
jgi:hypothetical protein